VASRPSGMPVASTMNQRLSMSAGVAEKVFMSRLMNRERFNDRLVSYATS
jgi:hypothetical protein